MASAEVTVIPRRRRFSHDQKMRFLDEAARTSMAAVARRHGIARSLLQRWKDMMIKEQASEPPAFVRLLPEAAESSPSAACSSRVPY